MAPPQVGASIWEECLKYLMRILLVVAKVVKRKPEDDNKVKKTDEKQKTLNQKSLTAFCRIGPLVWDLTITQGICYCV